MIASSRSQDQIERVAEQYKADGYDVLVRPAPQDLPDFLHRFDIDLLARKDDERVVIAVRRRGEFCDEIELAHLAGDPGSERLQRLADRAEQLLDQGQVDAACLIGWSALEASLREVARRLSIPLEQKDPQSVLNSLYIDGVFTRDEYDSLQAALRARNAVAHGLDYQGLTPATPRFLVESARRMLTSELSEITA